MPERDWQIPQKVAREQADDYAAAQRRAFLDGFEAAMAEAESMAELREWIEAQRDDAQEMYDEDDDGWALARRHAFIEVLVKLHEMGCAPEEAGDE